MCLGRIAQSLDHVWVPSALSVTVWIYWASVGEIREQPRRFTKQKATSRFTGVYRASVFPG